MGEIKGQAFNGDNANNIVINNENNNMLKCVDKITTERKEMDTILDTYLQTIDGDIKEPFMDTFNLLIHTCILAEAACSSRIHVNMDYISELENINK